MTDRAQQRLLVTVILLAVLAIAAGIAVTGGPVYQRQLKMDRIRSSDLQQLKRYIADYAQRYKTLPSSLKTIQEDLENRMAISSGINVFQDPATEAPYEYRYLSPEQFFLCANFETDTTKTKELPQITLYGIPEQSIELHPKGLTCYMAQKSKDSRSEAFEWFKKI
jgi:type II secretory pathway pseudopilin PulG